MPTTVHELRGQSYMRHRASYAGILHESRRDLARLLSGKDNGTKVTAILENGRTEILDLVEQALVVSQEIDDKDTASNERLFRELLNIIVSVSDDRQDQVYGMLER